jgi:inosose dehydratase
MRSLPLSEALAALAQIGYECTELPVMPDWPGDSRRLNAAARSELRRQLEEHHLRLAALMENLPLAGEGDEQSWLDRLRWAVDIAVDFTTPSGQTATGTRRDGPVVETILGGRPGSFEMMKRRLADRLRRWAEVAASGRVVVAIKAHVNNAVQRPEQLIWLVTQVASPWIKATYDYSHFQVQGLTLAESLRQIGPYAAFVHVKDGQLVDGRPRFLLPGQGQTDYPRLWQMLVELGYRGDVVVEVSSQISSAGGYDPLAAARQCYRVLADARQQALRGVGP